MRLGRHGRRLTVGLAAVCVLLAVVGVRLVQLQGVDLGNYAQAAAAERLVTVPLNAARGSIVDRNGVVLAYTADAKDIVADPSQVKAADRANYAMQLAPLIGKPANAIATALAVKGRYALLGSAVQPGPAAKIDKLELPGIYVEATNQRLYPGGTTGGNVIGLVHSDGAGAAGIEQQYDSVLRGTNGTYTYERDANGNPNPAGVSKRTPAVDGGTVRLTISQDLQYFVQTQLDSAVAQTHAKDGQVVVLDRHTGQVLAMAATGTFNPGDPSTVDGSNLNPDVQTVYEPGSVNKVVTFTSAIATKTITPLSRLSVPDEIPMGGVVVHDAWWHPVQTFTATGVLAESSNVGTLEIAQKVGPATVDDYLQRFGLGQKTGIELPGETGGILPARKDWSASTFANLPIGQGVAMTALQMTSMYQTIANGGVRIPPRIVASVTHADGSVSVTKQPAGIRVTDPATAQTVRTMLESVTLKGGTGPLAQVPGYRVAGKTGTAQQVDPKTGQYSDSVYWDTFAGMAPADDPQFVVGIMIDNPAKGLEGGDAAAPLFRHIAAYQLQHERIAPSGSQSRYVPLQIP